MWTRGADDWTTNPAISGRPSLPPEWGAQLNFTGPQCHVEPIFSTFFFQIEHIELHYWIKWNIILVFKSLSFVWSFWVCFQAQLKSAHPLHRQQVAAVSTFRLKTKPHFLGRATQRWDLCCVWSVFKQCVWLSQEKRVEGWEHIIWFALLNRLRHKMILVQLQLREESQLPMTESVCVCMCVFVWVCLITWLLTWLRPVGTAAVWGAERAPSSPGTDGSRPWLVPHLSLSLTYSGCAWGDTWWGDTRETDESTDKQEHWHKKKSPLITLMSSI